MSVRKKLTMQVTTTKAIRGIPMVYRSGSGMRLTTRRSASTNSVSTDNGNSSSIAGTYLMVRRIETVSCTQRLCRTAYPIHVFVLVSRGDTRNIITYYAYDCNGADSGDLYV